MRVRGTVDPREAAARRVFLSFDDGPDARWTPEVLELLAAAGARATFFVIGRAARGERALLRRIAACGHEVGNHTWSHRHPWSVSATAARREVRDGAAAIEDILGCRSGWFRPPYGRLRAAMVEEARELGQELVLWHRSAVDWGLLGRARWIRRRLARVTAGDIVLMHDGARGSNRPAELIGQLPWFLQDLDSRRLEPSLLPGEIGPR